MPHRPETLNAAQRQAAADYLGPKSACGTLSGPGEVVGCGHPGDGEGVSRISTVSTHKDGGLGACTYRDCLCKCFTWRRYTADFEKLLRTLDD